MTIMMSTISAETYEDNASLVSGVPRVVVCIPAFNEGRTIGRVIQAARTFACHILVCDDGSTDNTSTEVLKNGATLLTHESNRGKGVALKTLLREASKLQPDVVVTLDADGQHDPADVPRLTSPILNGAAEVVIGSRFNDKNVIPLYRRLGNSFLSRLTNLTARTRIRDTQSGFRAYSSNVISEIAITEHGMGVDSEILIKIAKSGFRIAERSISVSYNGDTSTFNPVSHTLRVLRALIRSQYQIHPGAPKAAALFLSSLSALFLGLMVISISPFSLVGLATSILSIGAGGTILAIVGRRGGLREDRVPRRTHSARL